METRSGRFHAELAAQQLASWQRLDSLGPALTAASAELQLAPGVC